MRRALLALALAAVAVMASAPPATAGHNLGPVPDGQMVVNVLYIQVALYAFAPTSHVDQLWVQACGATTGQPVHCKYTPRQCTPSDLALLCQL